MSFSLVGTRVWPWCVAALVGLSLGGASARAGIVVDFTPEAPLDHLHVGDKVVIDLSLRGLTGGETLIGLNEAVLYDRALVSTSGSTRGAIVPASGVYFGPGDDDHGDGNGVRFHLTPRGAHGITTSGVFARFVLTAEAVGTGSLSFDQAWGQTRNGESVCFGGPISYQIEPPTPPPSLATPEPATLGMATIAVLIGLLLPWQRRHRESPNPGSAPH